MDKRREGEGDQPDWRLEILMVRPILITSTSEVEPGANGHLRAWIGDVLPRRQKRQKTSVFDDFPNEEDHRYGCPGYDETVTGE